MKHFWSNTPLPATSALTIWCNISNFLSLSFLAQLISLFLSDLQPWRDELADLQSLGRACWLLESRFPESRFFLTCRAWDEPWRDFLADLLEEMQAHHHHHHHHHHQHHHHVLEKNSTPLSCTPLSCNYFVSEEINYLARVPCQRRLVADTYM